MNQYENNTFTTKQWLQFFFVGLFPWVTVNSVFAELAVFNRYMPEGKELSSQAGLACQIANISLIYVYLRSIFQDRFITIEKTVYILLFLTIISCLTLSFLWQVTIGGHSIIILACTFSGGIVGILSIVTLYPWASNFQQPKAISALSTGTAASSLIGSLLGLIQGAGETTQRFSPFVYMFILSLLAIISAYCFYSLNNNNNNDINNKFNMDNDNDDDEGEKMKMYSNNNNVEKNNYNSKKNTSLLTINTNNDAKATLLIPNNNINNISKSLNWKRLIVYILMPVIVQFFNCSLNYALLPGIVPYLICGHQLTFWFTLLISFSNVFGRFISTFCQHNRMANLLPFLIFLMICLFTLAFILASSTPSIKRTGLIEILAGIGVAIFAGLNGYIESLVFLVPSRILKDENDQTKELGLQIVGVIGQVGAFIGTAATAGLVTESNTFHQC